MRIETIILSNLIYNEEYTRKVLPYIKDEYFEDPAEKKIYQKIETFFNKYNALPTKEILAKEVNSDDKIEERIFSSIMECLDGISYEEKKIEWLVDSTEDFCQKRAIYNGLMESIRIADGEDKEKGSDAIPSILQKALGVSFDNHIGHDFTEDADERWEYYNSKEDRIPFDIEILNRITNGGIPGKSLNVFAAPTNVGKTLVLCHFAATNLLIGKNVLYITMEMAEKRIAERIDANLLNIPMDQLDKIPKETFQKKIMALKKKTVGKLIVKEYPTGGANVNHFRHLLNELKIKKDFVPDVIYIDYINICSSSRYRSLSNVNSYNYVKAITEELRGLSVEFGPPVISATQINREGAKDSNPTMENVSDSYGVPQTVDFLMIMNSNDDLAKLGQISMKQEKSRYANKNTIKNFVVGVDYSKQRIYDVEDSAQTLMNDTPIMDETAFGERSNNGIVDFSVKKKNRDFSKLFGGE